jgi:hypothetical protein
MAENPATRPTSISGNGGVVYRQRPSQLLLVITLKAVAATLELQLTKLQQQREASTKWLMRLGAARVDVGAAHFPDQAPKDPMMHAQLRTMQRMSGKSTSEEKKEGVRAVLTAIWDIGALSAEQLLVLLDRLRFETAVIPTTTEETEEPSPWSSPEEYMRSMMDRMRSGAHADDDAPEFFFIAKASEEQRTKALAEALARARSDAERVAQFLGVRLGHLTSLTQTNREMEHAAHRMIERQRCWGRLNGSAYMPGECEVLSDTPLPSEFGVTVHVQYNVAE